METPGNNLEGMHLVLFNKPNFFPK